MEKLTGYTRTSKAPYKCENLVSLRRHTYTLTHTQTPLSVRWAAALEGKFLQTHLYHCSLCSSCVRSLCCLNTMGGQGNHSSCQTDTPSPRQRVEWQQRDKRSQPTSPIFVFTHRFYMRVPLRSRLCTGLSFQSKSPGNVLFDISAATWQMLKIILCSALSPFFVLMKNNHNSQQ